MNIQQEIFKSLVKDCFSHQHCIECSNTDQQGCWGYMMKDIAKLLKERIYLLKSIATYNPDKEQFEISFADMGIFLKDNFGIDLTTEWK